jgi:hypothetical protein
MLFHIVSDFYSSTSIDIDFILSQLVKNYNYIIHLAREPLTIKVN